MSVVRTDGQAGKRSVTWLPNFLGWVVYHIFFPMVLRCPRFARKSSAILDEHPLRSVCPSWRITLWTSCYPFLKLILLKIGKQEVESLDKKQEMVRRRPSKSGRSRSSRLRVNRDTFHFILGETEDLITKERTRFKTPTNRVVVGINIVQKTLNVSV